MPQYPNLLSETPMLDFRAPIIQSLIATRGWANLTEHNRIGAVYGFVKDAIRFGYNQADTLPASQVLRQGYGQCNTKATLLMALLRAVGIPCRLHGFTIKKALQRGVVPELIYPIAPESILHSWVEVFYENTWVNLEGFILDAPYLAALQTKFKHTNSLCGYGAGTNTLSAPNVDWHGQDTYIQKTGINMDFGIFESPDDFYAAHQQNFSLSKRLLYQLFIRHWMNIRVAKFRNGGL